MHEYLARSAGLRDVREFTRGMTPMQYKKASKAIAGIRVRARTRALVWCLATPSLFALIYIKVTSCAFALGLQRFALFISKPAHLP